MFTIDLRQGLFSDSACLSAKAESLNNAIAFVKNFSIDGMIIAGNWVERDGRYVMEVFDWYDCWFANPLALGTITAPVGFVPSHATGASVAM
jgi:hypothetical protein